MTVKVGGNAVPASMVDRGTAYVFARPAPVARNGQGDVVTAGGCTLAWSWDFLSLSEWTFWVTTVLAGLPFRRLAGAGTTVLLNDLGVEETFASCVVVRPTAQLFTGGYYRGVTLQIEQLYA